MHDKRNLWLTSTEMYTKGDLNPHSSETERTWFVVDALDAVMGAANIMVQVNLPDNKAVFLTFAAGLFSLDLCDLNSMGGNAIYTGKYWWDHFFVEPPTILASKHTHSKEQVLLWFVASPDEQWSVIHFKGGNKSPSSTNCH